MSELVEYLNTSTQRLSKDVSNVDDVGNTLRWLRDLRQREADLEQVDCVHAPRLRLPPALFFPRRRLLRNLTWPCHRSKCHRLKTCIIS